MRIRYAIEKEIEVPDNLTAMDIDDIISQKCEGENGFDYQWMSTSEINEQHLTGLFDELRWSKWKDLIFIKLMMGNL